MTGVALRAVDAFSEACKAQPSLVRDQSSRRGIGLYGWNTGPVKEVHLPGTGEMILSLHLGGSRRVRLFTNDGLSRSVSKPGDITLMPHGQPISFRTEGAVDFVTVHFPSQPGTRRSPEALARMLNLSSCLFAFRDDYICASVKALMHAARTPSAANAAYSSKVFASLISHLARLVGDSNAERIHLPARAERGLRQPDFAAVLTHIEQRLADKLTLDILAEWSGVSRAVFAREFNARFKCSPHRFLTARRVERAKLLLDRGELSLADVAYEVGFSGQSHFTTTFKAFEGCTPHAFVNRALR